METMCESVDILQAARQIIYGEKWSEQILYRITSHISFCKFILRKTSGFQEIWFYEKNETKAKELLYCALISERVCFVKVMLCVFKTLQTNGVYVEMYS